MSVNVQGGQVDFEKLRTRLAARRDLTSFSSRNDQDLRAVFDRLTERHGSFMSMERLLQMFAQDIVAFKFDAAKSYLLSRANIMRNRQKTIAISTIEQTYRPHVESVIRGNAQLPNFNHNTDPRTGAQSAGPLVREFYLPNVSGKRMTRRTEGGKVSFYFSNGTHALNQYYYALITDGTGRPILRGGYADELQVPV